QFLIRGPVGGGDALQQTGIEPEQLGDNGIGHGFSPAINTRLRRQRMSMRNDASESLRTVCRSFWHNSGQREPVHAEPTQGVVDMINPSVRDAVARLLPRVQMPAQYTGGELNAVVKDHRRVRGKLCLAFPETYALGMSHHGLQVLYSIMSG